MRTDRRALLEQADRELLAALFAQLAQPDSRSEPGRPSAHDDHVVVHHLPLLRHHLELLLGELRRGRASAHVPLAAERPSGDAAPVAQGGLAAGWAQPVRRGQWVAQPGAACCAAQHL